MRGRTVMVVPVDLLLMAEQRAAAENEPKVIMLACEATLSGE
jgi:hypothetical protein